MANVKTTLQEGINLVKKFNDDVKDLREKLRKEDLDSKKLKLMGFKKTLTGIKYKKMSYNVYYIVNIIKKQNIFYKNMTQKSYAVIGWLKIVKKSLGLKHLPHDYSIFVTALRSLRSPILNIRESLNKQIKLVQKGNISEFKKEYKRQLSAERHLRKLPARLFLLIYRFTKRNSKTWAIRQDIEKLRREGVKNPEAVFVTSTTSFIVIASLLVGFISAMVPDAPFDPNKMYVWIESFFGGMMALQLGAIPATAIATKIILAGNRERQEFKKMLSEAK